jgi:hypothetical protein
LQKPFQWGFKRAAKLKARTLAKIKGTGREIKLRIILRMEAVASVP